MRSSSRWATNLPRKTRDIALAGAFGALLFVAQVALSFLPNIELVSILVIVYTLVFQGQVIWTLGVFILLEGLVYGFGTWWVSYLYLWPALAGLTWLFRNMQSSLGWAILAAAYGLGFGALCAIPYLLTGGWTAGLSYWVSGIPFDLAHCGGNFVAALALYRPLRGALTRLQTALLA
jgi:energy-coupling factor transport system substrate-specific component